MGDSSRPPEWQDAREEWLNEGTSIAPEQTRILRTLAEALSGERVDIGIVLQQAVEAVANLYGDGVFVALASDDGRTLRPVAVHHPDARARREALELTSLSLDIGSGFFARVAETGTPLLLPDLSAEAAVRRRPELAGYAAVAGIRRAILVPLRARGRLLGALSLMRGRPMALIAPGDQAFLEEVADRLASGIEASRMASALARQDAPPDKAPVLEDLTPRETETLDLIARGLTNREIGERLHLSVRTIEWRRERIQLKLGVAGRAALVKLARRCGLGG
jgi:DNA-binding CsgD family transcriptional regulator